MEVRMLGRGKGVPEKAYKSVQGGGEGWLFKERTNAHVIVKWYKTS